MLNRVLLTVCLLLMASCRKSNEGDLGEMINVGDPRMAVQLIAGFHDIEQGWRWTAGEFSAGVKVPRRADSNGAVLVMGYSIPEAILANRKQTTITARIAGNDLPMETCTKPGLREFRREIPAAWLKEKTTVRVDFKVAPATAPSDTDKRELGLIIHTLGLARKK